MTFDLLRRTGLALLLIAGAAGCASTENSVSDGGDEWLEPSSQLKQRIEDQARILPWTHGLERVELIRWFASVGEPAYPTLLAMVEDPRSDVAGAALAALGATGDSRLVEHLRELPWPEGDANADLALERARTQLRLGDWTMTPILIEGLSDERVMTRALCSQALYEATRERFGFNPRDEEAKRNAAISRWERWWRQKSEDPMIGGIETGGELDDRNN
jgi:hypothetical protein